MLNCIVCGLNKSQPLRLSPVSRQILTDASGKGWVAVSDGDSLKGLLEQEMQVHRSNIRIDGSLAFQRYPLTFDSAMLVLSDNKPTVACINTFSHWWYFYWRDYNTVTSPKAVKLPAHILSQTVQGIKVTCSSRIYSDIHVFHFWNY